LTSYGTGYSDVYLIKTDSFGDTRWTRTYGGPSWDGGYSVVLTSDGGYIIAGETWSFGAGVIDIYLIKTDSLGDTIWTKTYGGTGWDCGRSVTQTSDGGYIIAGYTESYGVGGDFYLIKTDENGDTIWTRTYGGTGWDCGRSVAQTSDGGYIIAGYTRSYGAGADDVYLIKTDSLGDTLWTRTYGGTDYEYGYLLAQTSDGGYIVVGNTYSYGAGMTDVYLIKTDSLGNVAGIEEKPHPSPETANTRLTCQPNPFTTVTSIKLLGQRKNSKTILDIYDASGRLVKSVKLTTNTHQFGADLVPGIYFIKADGRYVGKVVKLR